MPRHALTSISLLDAHPDLGRLLPPDPLAEGEPRLVRGGEVVHEVRQDGGQRGRGVGVEAVAEDGVRGQERLGRVEDPGRRSARGRPVDEHRRVEVGRPRVEAARAGARRLALGDGLSDEEARLMAAEGKAIVCIAGGLHADEVLGAQQLIELVYELARGDDPETLRVLRSDRTGSSAPDKGDADEFEIDTRRIVVTVDPAAEWRQMFDEAGRLMRDHFWVGDMAGVDWAAELARYRPLVDAVGSVDDLVDVLWEVNGELGGLNGELARRSVGRVTPQDACCVTAGWVAAGSGAARSYALGFGLLALITVVAAFIAPSRYGQREAIVEMLCDAKPQSRPGQSLAYHAISGGYIIGEVIQRDEDSHVHVIPLGTPLGEYAPLQRMQLVVGALTHTYDKVIVVADRPHDRQIGQLCATHVRIVDADLHVGLELAERLERRLDTARHRSQMDGDVLGLRDHLSVAVEDRGRAVDAFLDVR